MKLGKSINKYRKSLSDKEARILSDLSYKGKTIFSLEDIREYNVNPKNLIYNLTRKNWILRLKKGVYLIAPLEAGELGARSHTVHSFVIASHLVEPYYISHWSALNYHGLTEQTPPAVYIASTKPRNGRRILDTDFVFVAIAKHKMFGVEEIKIEDNVVNISTPEKTVVDCLDHPEHCGGIVEVARVIFFEHKSLDFKEMVNMAKRMRNGAILKRLGYLLETLKLESYSEILGYPKLSKGYARLDTKLPGEGRINERWRIIVNAIIEPDRWTR